MVETWLIKDEVSVLFDSKEQTELLGLSKLPSAQIVFLSKEEALEFTKATKEYFKWQLILRNKMRNGEKVS